MKVALLCEPGPTRRFAQLRARQMAVGLAGHDLTLVDAHAPEPADVDAVVTAGNGPPLRAALRYAADRPLWLDLPGDPLAEAEIAATFADDPEVVLRDARAVVLPALARADVISVISERQRHATEAMLALLGRRDVPVHVVPIAMDFDLPPGPARPAGHTVALLGGFNHWVDEDRIIAVLLAAARRAPLRVVSTEGAIPGHHDAGWKKLRAALGSLLELRGDPPHEALPATFADAHVALNVDRPCREADLGSRTRVLFARHLGLRVVSTGRTELVTALAAEGQVDLAETDEALVEALVMPRAAPPPSPRWASLGRDTTTLALSAWRPRRAIPGPVDLLSPLVADRAEALAELEALRSTPTWRALNRVHRVLRRA